MSERRGDRAVRPNAGRYSVPKFQFKDKLLQQTLQSMKNSLDALQGDVRQGLNKGKNQKRAVSVDPPGLQKLGADGQQFGARQGHVIGSRRRMAASMSAANLRMPSRACRPVPRS